MQWYEPGMQETRHFALSCGENALEKPSNAVPPHLVWIGPKPSVFKHFQQLLYLPIEYETSLSCNSCLFAHVSWYHDHCPRFPVSGFLSQCSMEPPLYAGTRDVSGYSSLGWQSTPLFLISTPPAARALLHSSRGLSLGILLSNRSSKRLPKSLPVITCLMKGSLGAPKHDNSAIICWDVIT